ncbi:MAG TPA: S8 family serine peptidase [Candidatus Eisenbacteria bacterium]|nr:S8 family serine peptidase [Candidatus Eisenbacteria bacterium]
MTVSRWKTRGRSAAPGPLLAACLLTAVVAASWFGARPAQAAKYTPAAWKREIPDSLATRFASDKVRMIFLRQRKFWGWIRDANHDFVDDKLPARAESVNVIVDMNDCYSVPGLVDLLSPYGRVSYTGKMVSCVFLDGVKRSSLAALARLPQVAMIEWRAPFRPSMGVSVRATQAAPSDFYGPEYVRRYDPEKGWVDHEDLPALTGAGVNIAILDTGVRNDHPTLPSKSSTGAGGFVAGCDATGSTATGGVDVDPDATNAFLGHGSRVASIAMGRIPTEPGADCGKETAESVAPDCAGVAPEAGLVDVKVWNASSDSTSEFLEPPDAISAGSVMKGIDWIGVHKEEYRIAVVNISLSNGLPCDGDCAACSAVNYLAAIGVTPVVGFGNASDGESDEDRTRVETPAAAADAITVAGSYDHDTAARGNDEPYDLYLIGPTTGGKPDLSAPAQDVYSLGYPSSPDEPEYTPSSGTSFAAPLASGAAALLIESDPYIDPANVKDILVRTVDDTLNNGGLKGWDSKLGNGLLNVYGAVQLRGETDLRFASCSETEMPSSAGEPCPLENGRPSYSNIMDLTVLPDPPERGRETTITAAILNDGEKEAVNFYVTFGYYEFGTGTAKFHDIDRVLIASLPPHEPMGVSCRWVPDNSDHQCLQATIQYGPDTNYGNNTTQRNITWEASSYTFKVENPYMDTAKFYVRTKSDRAGWPCYLEDQTQSEFILGGPDECPKTIRIGFRAPQDAPIGARATCDVSVYASRRGASDSVLVGGVTVGTLVPRDCLFTGRVTRSNGRPVAGAKLYFQREIPPDVLPAPWERERPATTDRRGGFSVAVPPESHKTLRVVLDATRQWSIPVRLHCGGKPLQIELGKEGPRVVE